MHVDVNGELEVKGKGGFETKGVNRATNFELTDYWNGGVLSGTELWPVRIMLNVVHLFFCLNIVLFWRCCTCIQDF